MEKEELMKQLGLNEEELSDRVQRSKDSSLESDAKRTEVKQGGVSFKELSEKYPGHGALLESKDGELVKVYEDWKEKDGEPIHLMLCNAVIDDDATGWYLHSRPFGMKCIISLRSQERVTEGEDGLYVKCLRVLRLSKTGKSLICEVVE